MSENIEINTKTTLYTFLGQIDVEVRVVAILYLDPNKHKNLRVLTISGFAMVNLKILLDY